VEQNLDFCRSGKSDRRATSKPHLCADHRRPIPATTAGWTVPSICLSAHAPSTARLRQDHNPHSAKPARSFVQSGFNEVRDIARHQPHQREPHRTLQIPAAGSFGRNRPPKKCLFFSSSARSVSKFCIFGRESSKPSGFFSATAILLKFAHARRQRPIIVSGRKSAICGNRIRSATQTAIASQNGMMPA